MNSPIRFITVGRFGSEKYWKKERELFLRYKKRLINDQSGFEIREDSLEGMDENKINEIIKQCMKVNKGIIYITLSTFMKYMGLSYYILNQDEINEIEEMDFTYENWEKKSKILYDKFLKNSQEIFPIEVKFCFEDKFFPIYDVFLKDTFKKIISLIIFVIILY